MKYYFWILGCAMNYSDAERMSTILESLGYTKTTTEKEADLFIVISCSVRQSAVLKIYGKVKELNEYRLQNPNFKTILTGCVLDKDKKKLGKVFDILMTMEDLSKLPNLLNYKVQVPNNKQVRSTKTNKPKEFSEPEISNLSGIWDLEFGAFESYFNIKPHYQNNFRAYVPISTGCDNFCSYCAVPYTKGREKSRSMDEIITEVKNLVGNGYKEITLLGQNVNSFGINNKKQITNNKFIDLLTALDVIPGDHRIYFYSNHPKDMTDDLISTLATLKHFPHYIHLPLQSGNDDILRKMNRHSTQEQYLELVAKIRKAMPDINLTTDIIVGFPSETDEQFQDTVEVMEKAEYDMAFIAQYSPRPGTASAKMDDNITDEVKKERELVLQKIITKTVLKHNEKLIGTTQRVLIDGEKGGKYYGRTEGYKVVEINANSPTSLRSMKQSLNADIDCHVVPPRNDKKKTDQSLQIGQFVNVKIESVSSWKLIGSLLPTSS